MNDTCIDCKHMAYQYTLEGDMVAMCTLRNEQIDQEESFGCVSFDDAEYPF
jgi:hypothetical protein